MVDENRLYSWKFMHFDIDYMDTFTNSQTLQKTLNITLNANNANVQYALILDTSTINSSSICRVISKIVFQTSIRNPSFQFSVTSLTMVRCSFIRLPKNLVAEQVRKVLVYVGRHRRPPSLWLRGVRVRMQGLVSRGSSVSDRPDCFERDSTGWRVSELKRE